MRPPTFDHFLRYVEILMQVLLLCLLWRRSLLRRYGSFALWVGGMVLRAAALLWVPYTSLLYSRLWAMTQPILWALQLMALLEVMQLIYEQYPRLGEPAKLITKTSFAAGVLLGLVFTFVDLGSVRMPWWLDATLTTTKVVSWATCFILLAQHVWFAMFPVPMVPNVRTHRRLFCFYAGVLPGLAYLVAGIGPPLVNLATNMIYMSGNVVVLILWCLLIRNSREYSPLEPPPGGAHPKHGENSSLLIKQLSLLGKRLHLCA